MTKDIHLKMKLIQYFLSKNWYPQLEVNVAYKESVSKTTKVITDIDVFAMAPNNKGVFNPVIGDCKTLKNQSAINRVFWIKGLMSYFSADYGVVLLSKQIEGEHQVLASELGVSLLSENDFTAFAIATSSLDDVKKSSIIVSDNWNKYFSISNRFSGLSSLIHFCRTGFWNEKEFSTKLRYSIASLREVHNELNPDNNLCMFIFLELASMFSISLNELAIRIFNKYLLPQDKSVFDQELKMLLWGGFDNYNFFNNLRKRVSVNLNNENTDLSLPEWNMFVNLARASIEKPLSIALAAIILKELAFCFLMEQDSANKWNYLETLVKKDSYALRIAIHIIDYLSKAAQLQHEFSDSPNAILMKLQRMNTLIL
jgi:hypothetical protein